MSLQHKDKFPSPEVLRRLTEEQRAIRFIESQPAGVMSAEFFEALARKVVFPTVELVPLRTSEEGKTQILLTQRPAGDTWEGQWHVPGTALRASDRMEYPHDFRDAFSRLLGPNGELKAGVRAIGEPVRIDFEVRETRRGKEVSTINYVEVEGEPTVGQYFDLEGFPDNVPAPGVIEHHVHFIADAANHFQQLKQQQDK